MDESRPSEHAASVVTEIVIEPRLRIRDVSVGVTVMETRRHSMVVAFWDRHRRELDEHGCWVVQYLTPDRGWRLVPESILRAWRSN
jgi:hypothetical protein